MVHPSIFTYDYEKIKQINLEKNKAIIEKVFHPSNMTKWFEWGVEDWEEF